MKKLTNEQLANAWAIAKTAAIVAQLDYPLDLEYFFNTRLRTTAGRVKRVGTRYTLEINPKTTEAELLPTMLHEWAHLVTMVSQPKASSHGPEWQENYRTLAKTAGLSNTEPERCHRDPQLLATAKQGRTAYGCANAHKDSPTCTQTKYLWKTKRYQAHRRCCTECGGRIVMFPAVRP